jgi:two-component system, chemotaxis family, protein-glutamate methylesterase/glutaminase
MTREEMKTIYETILIGVSAGGMRALTEIIPRLPEDFSVPVIVLQHLGPDGGDYLATHLDQISAVRVKEAEEGEVVEPGTVYTAPAGYHLLLEDDRSFALSGEPPVNYSRPAIDVLFESAVQVCGEQLIGLILTGANSDGAKGLAEIKAAGGLTIVQNPETAEADAMPLAAIRASSVDHILDLGGIAPFLCGIVSGETNG